MPVDFIWTTLEKILTQYKWQWGTLSWWCLAVHMIWSLSHAAVSIHLEARGHMVQAAGRTSYEHSYIITADKAGVASMGSGGGGCVQGNHTSVTAIHNTKLARCPAWIWKAQQSLLKDSDDLGWLMISSNTISGGDIRHVATWVCKRSDSVDIRMRSRHVVVHAT